nr:Interferon- developmental regulator 1 [Polyrhizophydium stewartii]
MGSMHSLEPPPSITRGGSSRSVRSFVDEQHAEETAEESLHKAFEDLAEKRSSLRESALHQIIRSLSTKFMPEAVEKSAGPWIESLKRCLRREGSEPLLANRALALLWISGGSQPEHFDDLVKLLGEGLLDGEAEVKASCVRTLAMIVFIENAGDSVMQELLSSWEDVLEAADQHDPEVVRNTLEAYGLIYAMPSARPGHDDYNRVLDMHLELLNADDLDVRIAAGENIAIIDEPENTKPFYESRHQLIQQLTFLSHDSTRHRAKKERAVQKSAFRDILQTVEVQTS